MTDDTDRLAAGWAALNTLREARDFVPDWYDGPPPYRDEFDAALALVQTALEAAEHRLKAGPNDTCANALNPDYDCSCGHAALAAALRAVREGK